MDNSRRQILEQILNESIEKLDKYFMFRSSQKDYLNGLLDIQKIFQVAKQLELPEREVLSRIYPKAAELGQFDKPKANIMDYFIQPKKRAQ